MPLAPTAPYLERIEAAIMAMPSGSIVHIADVLAAIFAGTGVTIDRSIANQITINATGSATPPSFSPTTLTAVPVVFDDATLKSASTDPVPMSATRLLVYVPLLGTEIWVPAARWRSKDPAAVGDVRLNANATPLALVDIYRGKEVRYWLARTAGNVPLVSYDRGRAGLETACHTYELCQCRPVRSLRCYPGPHRR